MYQFIHIKKGAYELFFVLECTFVFDCAEMGEAYTTHESSQLKIESAVCLSRPR